MLNTFMLEGNVTVDPKINIYTKQGGDKFNTANLYVAVARNKDEADFLSVDFTSPKTVEYVKNYVRKGDLVSITGSLRMDQWTDPDGTHRTKLKLRGYRLDKLRNGKNHTDAEPNESSDDFAPDNESDKILF